MNKAFTCLLIGAFFLLGVTACFQEDLIDLTLPDWNPDVAIPIANTEFKSSDIVNDIKSRDQIKTDSSGLISFVFEEKNVASIPAKDFLNLPDLKFLAEANSALLNLKFPSDDILDEIELNGGQFIYKIQVNEDQDVQVKLTIPDASKDGKPFEEIINLIHSGDEPLNVVDTVDLAGYLLDLTRVGDSVVSLAIKYEAIINSTGEKIPIDKFEGFWNDLKYSSVKGLFGLKDFEFKIDTLELDYLKHWLDGSVTLAKPKIEINVRNNYGLPFSLRLVNFNMENELLKMPVTGDVFEDSVFVKFPEDSLFFNDDTTNIVIDENNSNLENALTITPDKITYGLVFGTTPVLDSVVVINRVNDNSNLTADIKLELPFYTELKYLTLKDTFDFEIDKIKEVNDVTFRLVTENYFPLSTKIQVYFADQHAEILDSLFTNDENLLVSGEVDAEGTVIAPAEIENFITLKKDKLESIYDAKQVIVKATLLSGKDGEQAVKFLSSYRLDVQLGAITNLSFR